MRLKEVAKVQTGIAKGKKNEADLIELPYLRVANVQDGFLDLSEIKTIKLPTSKKARYALQVGDVLMTEGGDYDKLGRGTIWQGEVEDCLHQNHVFAVRANRARILPYYLSAYGGSDKGKIYFKSCSKQSTNLASINSTQLKSMPIPLPPLPEQHRIAHCLTTWDRAITTTRHLLDALRTRKRGLMQRLLTGEVRLPGFSEKWKRVKVGSFLSESRLSGTNGLDAEKLTVKLWGRGVRRKVDKQLGSVNTNYYTRKAGQLIYSKLDFLNCAFGIIPQHLDNLESTLDLPTFDFQDTVEPQFILERIKQRSFYERFGERANGSRKARRIHPDMFLSFPILLPPLKEQTAIATVLTAADREIALYEQKLETLETQKRGLMQQLLTGQKRLPA